MEEKNHKKIRPKTSFSLKAWDSAVLEINNITEKLPKPLLVLSPSTYCKHSSFFIIKRSSKKNYVNEVRKYNIADTFYANVDREA